jgi:hypothetical protein
MISIPSPGIRPLHAAELQQVSGGAIYTEPIPRRTGFGVSTDARIARQQFLQAAYDATHPTGPIAAITRRD